MQVQQGSQVEMEINGARQTWRIVGAGETDLGRGKVSFNAPLVQLIMGAGEGDQISGKILDREVLIKIFKIS